MSELRLLDARVDALVRADALVLASQQPDVSLSGRVHETFQQYHAGVPVYGGGISRQLANTGLTVSIFGTIYQEMDHCPTFASSIWVRSSGLFEQVLRLALELGGHRLGRVAVDGTKVKANASKHKAMSYGRMPETERRLKVVPPGQPSSVPRLFGNGKEPFGQPA